MVRGFYHQHDFFLILDFSVLGSRGVCYSQTAIFGLWADLVPESMTTKDIAWLLHYNNRVMELRKIIFSMARTADT